MHGIINHNIYYKKEREKDQLRMGGGAWSINIKEVDFTKIDFIVYQTEKARYVLSTANALAHGFERVLGGEDKLVVPLKHWRVTDNDTIRKKIKDD